MKSLNLLLAVILFVGCASVQKTNYKESDVNVAEVIEKSGVELDEINFRFKSFKITKASKSAKFFQSVKILPGEDMKRAVKRISLEPWQSDLSGGDSVIGVDGKVVWESQKDLESAIESVYNGNLTTKDTIVIGINGATDSNAKPLHTIQVISKDMSVRNILVELEHKRSDLDFSPHTQLIPVSVVKNVATGSWAEKSGIEKYDFIFGNLSFETAEKTKSKTLLYKTLVGYSVKETLEYGNVGIRNTAYGFLGQMFRKIKLYKPVPGRDDGVIGYGALMRNTAIIRDGKLIRKNLYRSVEIAVGVQFDCKPMCVSADAEIYRIPEDSPAYRDGLATGDIIESINGEKVHNAWDATQLLHHKFNLDDKLTFLVLRNGEPTLVTTSVGIVTEYK